MWPNSVESLTKESSKIRSNEGKKKVFRFNYNQINCWKMFSSKSKALENLTFILHIHNKWVIK